MGVMRHVIIANYMALFCHHLTFVIVECAKAVRSQKQVLYAVTLWYKEAPH